MDFFRAHQAIEITLPTYFIESTAPYNVDDSIAASATLPPGFADFDKYLKEVDPQEAIEGIATALLKGTDPNLVVMVHGFNNPYPAVLGMYTGAAIAIDKDDKIKQGEGLVCVGYRWPSEKMITAWQGDQKFSIQCNVDRLHAILFGERPGLRSHLSQVVRVGEQVPYRRPLELVYH